MFFGAPRGLGLTTATTSAAFFPHLNHCGLFGTSRGLGLATATPQENVHRDERPHYLHKDALAYRAEHTSSPSVPTHFKPVPPEAGFMGNIHEHVRCGKR